MMPSGPRTEISKSFGLGKASHYSAKPYLTFNRGTSLQRGGEVCKEMAPDRVVIQGHRTALKKANYFWIAPLAGPVLKPPSDGPSPSVRCLWAPLAGPVLKPPSDGPSPSVFCLVAVVVVAAIIGVAGGLMPALRASRVGIISALREA